ncbi:MAG: arsenate reductase [Chromatiales bacterium RIFOXYA1_FULL_46_5]|nr:MAG: arsenate reductase [Chromatiales bacterium RIFOXYA1_FULL_46_5]
MTSIYGIKNCDTIKKARKYLEQHQLPHQYIDYRQDGISAELLAEFMQQLEWQELLNTKGTTYRALPDADKQDMTADKAVLLMLTQPAMIKRPVLEHNGKFYLGFSEQQYQTLFGLSA